MLMTMVIIEIDGYDDDDDDDGSDDRSDDDDNDDNITRTRTYKYQ